MINRQLVQKMILHHTSNVMKMGKQEVHIKSDYKENADVKSLIDNKLKGFNQDIIHSMVL